MIKRKQTKDQLGNNVYNQLRNQLHDQLRLKSWDRLRDVLATTLLRQIGYPLQDRIHNRISRGKDND